MEGAPAAEPHEFYLEAHLLRFQKLWDLGELELGTEFTVLLPWFRDLFSLEEQAEAERRLILHDFRFSGGSAHGRPSLRSGRQFANWPKASPRL